MEWLNTGLELLSRIIADYFIFELSFFISS